MRTEVDVNADMFIWAITRAGKDFNEVSGKVPNLQKWMDGEKKPTVKQLQDFSRKVYLPFGYFFLAEPPEEKLPIPYFRSDGSTTTKVHINVYDSILLMQQRQEWLKEYLRENSFDNLPFVGRFKDENNVGIIVDDIRRTLGLQENWASGFDRWQDALNHLTDQIEDAGIITVFNGVVENNGTRKIPIESCRGFVLVDNIAPFMFINNSDSKAAQMLTVVHELAHIWTGKSAGFDFRQLQPAQDSNEILCDKIAAEFLVPERTFNEVWQRNQSIKDTARFFKVSRIVIARRALDTGKLTKTQFFQFYNEYIAGEIRKKSSGGDFYATTRKRLSITFAAHINNAVRSGQLLYRDAYKLTSLKGDTFHNFFDKHL